MKTFIKTHGGHLLYTLLVAFLFCGCNEPNVKERSTDYTLDVFGGKIKIIEVDSCEYLFYESGHRMAIAHKGNCKYCTERAKNNCN